MDLNLLHLSSRAVTQVEGTASIGYMKFPQQRAGSPEEWWKRAVFLKASVQN